MAMIHNYLKIALRNLRKHPGYAFLNIFGLALSMSVCLFIIMLIKDAHSYDVFHPEGQRVYRILTDAQRKNGGEEAYASSPFTVGKALTDDYAQVELWTPLVRTFGGTLLTGERSFDFQGMLTDGSFFDMFGFELAEGDPETALSEPYSIVLTTELAERIFKNENPVGKTLKAPGYAQDFKVSGVLKKFPGKTHLEFTALGSLATQLAEEKVPETPNVTASWQNYYMTYNFVRLKNGADKKTAERALADIVNHRYNGLELESRDAGYRFRLQPLNNITPGANLSNSMGRGMPVFLIWFFTALGVIIILSASFNYTNLTIARSLLRTKEVGVRKVMGASRWQVFGQIVGESVVASLLALVLAYPLMKLVKPQFEQLSITESLDVQLQENWQLYGLFMLFSVAVGIVAGLLPAFTLSKVTPLAVLQKLQHIRLIQRIGLRKALLVTQFAVTLLFFIILTVAWRQVDHAIAANFGFDQPQTLLVELQGQDYGKVSAALGQLNGVEKVSGISFPMGTWEDGVEDVRTETAAEKTGVRQYHIDHNYLDHFGLQLAAGDYFPANPAQQKELFAIVNETFVQKFELGTPGEAVGKPIIVGDSLQLTIRGVLKDFRFKPAVYAMEPLLLRYDPARLGVLNLRLSGGDPSATMTALERSWKKLDSGREFRAAFFDETVRENYAELLDMARIVGFFGILGIVIACLGLLGMAVYTVETRAKEVSIRKVLGAGAADVVLMLSKGYLMLTGIAALIAVPLGYLLGSQLLQIFSDRISMSPALFLPGVLLLLTATLITVGSQTIRAALANPAGTLRSE